MFVLGIDPGLTRTGYGVVEASGWTHRAVTAGAIVTDRRAGLGARLVELHHDLRELIAEHSPSAVAVERVFVNQNLRTAMSVARASGVAVLAAAQAGIEVVEYTPSAIKMALVGYGSAPKDQVQKVVAMRLGLTTAPQPADAADALAIALCHLQSAPLAARVGAAT